MRRFLIAGICLVAGYAVGAVAGGLAIANLSANTHDRSVEAAMSGAFVTGPAMGIVCLFVYLIVSRRR